MWTASKAAIVLGEDSSLPSAPGALLSVQGSPVLAQAGGVTSPASRRGPPPRAGPRPRASSASRAPPRPVLSSLLGWLLARALAPLRWRTTSRLLSIPPRNPHVTLIHSRLNSGVLEP